MKNITQMLLDHYKPVSVIATYSRGDGYSSDAYVEHCDVDEMGNMINAHPLSTRETLALARRLNAANGNSDCYITCPGILPAEVLHISPSPGGNVVWYTPAGKRFVNFSDKTGIPSGTATVPALIWQANLQSLHLFAIKDTERPGNDTALYHAPFFNVSESGTVCMGTTKLSSLRSCRLPEFIREWERLFFGSKFSHLSFLKATKKSCAEIWKSLVNTEDVFPVKYLISSKKALKQIL